MNTAHRCAALAIATITSVALLAAPLERAEACSPAAEQLEFTVPADGAVVPEAPPMFAVFSGFTVDRRVELMHIDPDDDHPTGRPIELEEQENSLGGFTLRKTKFVPQEPLEEGEYAFSIVYTDEEQQDFVEDQQFSFTIGNYAEIDDPGAPDFSWHHIDTPGTCYGDRTTVVEIEPTDDSTHYYEILVDDEDGSTTRSLVEADDEQTVRREMTTESTECVTVTPVAVDGTTGEPVEQCPQPLPESRACNASGTDASSVPGWLMALVLLSILGVAGRPSVATSGRDEA